MRFIIWTTYGTTYNHDICINLSWSGTRNGEYEPYEKHSYPLDSSLTLRGIPKLDAENNMYFDGDEYLPDGTVNRRYGVVDLGTLNWSYFSDSSTTFFTASNPSDMKPIESNTTRLNGICTKYTIRALWSDGFVNMDKVIAQTNALRVRDSAYSDAATFKTAMSGVMLVYELATPTTESTDPYNSVQQVNDWGTEEFVSETIVPVGHATRYPANLRDKLQHLPDLASADGYYVVQQTGSQMSLVHFRIPQAPTTDGTYILKATVSGGTPTYVWEVVE